MRSFVVLLFIVLLAMPSAALAKGGGSSGGGGGRSSGGSSGGSRPSSSSSRPSSSGGSSSSSRPSIPKPSGGRLNAPPQRIVPSRPPRVPARVVSRIRPPVGRVPARDQRFLRRNGGRYLNPNNRAYYGWPSSPYHYLYLWAFYGNHCESVFNPEVCPQPPHSKKPKAKCGGGAFLPLPFAGGALAWVKRRRRRKDS